MADLWIRLWDGAYDRKDDSTFPDCAEIQYKGNGILQTLRERHMTDYQDSWCEETFTLDVSGSNQSEITIGFDVQGRQCYNWTNFVELRTDYIQILDGQESVVWSWSFDSGSVVMERTGTVKDYGHYRIG